MRDSRYKKLARARVQEEKPEIFDSVSSDLHQADLWAFREMYDNLRGVRDNYERNSNYEAGRQWSDRITDPENPSKSITEEEFLKRQGAVPLKNNLIKKTVKAVLGVRIKNMTDTVAVARDKVEQKYSDMMSIMLKYVYQINDLNLIDTRTLHNFLLSGFCCQSLHYRWDRTLGRYDIEVRQENLNTVFFNSNTVDPLMKDITTFGVLRDMQLADVVQAFARTPERAKQITEMYSNISAKISYSYRTYDKARLSNTDFFRSNDRSLCRVIEAWTLETKERLRVTDYEKGEVFITELNNKSRIDAGNELRIKEYGENGVPEEEVPLMEYEWFLDKFWYARYLTPVGEVLFETESKFNHNSSPFVFTAYPLINGEIQAFVEDFIDQQRYINRYITMMDFMRRASAKGVLIFPEESLGDMTKEGIVSEWTKPNGVIFAKTKDRLTDVKSPVAISSNVVQASDAEMIKLQMGLIDEISGVHGALQGAPAKSGTASSLYAQEAQNSATNLIAIMQTFSYFIKGRDMKLMKMIQQYYTEDRYVNVAGNEYSEEAKMYEAGAIKDLEFDVNIAEMPTTAAFRSVTDGLLMELVRGKVLDLKSYLSVSSLPFASKLLDELKKKEELMAQGQIPQMLDGASAEALPTNPKADAMIEQAMGGIA